jgi:hypothetical protein
MSNELMRENQRDESIVCVGAKKELTRLRGRNNGGGTTEHLRFPTTPTIEIFATQTAYPC